MTRKLAFLLPLGAVFAFAACGDDTGGTTSGDTTTSSSSSSSTSTSSSGGSSSGMGGAGGASGSSSSGMGGSPAMGACTNAADQAIVTDPTKMLQQKVTDCGKNNLGMEPATKNCIAMLGLTPECTTCFDDNVQCVAKNCFAKCIPDPSVQACTDCRAMFCDMPFTMCSGLPPNG